MIIYKLENYIYYRNYHFDKSIFQQIGSLFIFKNKYLVFSKNFFISKIFFLNVDFVDFIENDIF